MQVTHLTESYIEGGNIISKDLYLGTKYGDITISRGVFSSNQMWDFSQHPMRSMEQLSRADLPKINEFRSNLTIQQLDNSSNVVKQWNVIDAWVKDYKLAVLDAESSEISIESITLSHSGIVLGDFSFTVPNSPQNVGITKAVNAIKPAATNKKG